MHDLDWTQLETPESAFELSGGGELGELFSGESEGGDTSRELELAAELLEVRSDQELEQFLDKLLSTVAQGAQQIARSPVGRQLGGILKDAAKQALPVVGGALGNALAPGGQGQAWGRRGARAFGDLLGLELEGLSQEDREFEVSRRVVQFARQAWRNLDAGPQAGPAWAIARAAATEAARQYAPGLVAALAAAPAGPAGSPSRQLAATPAQSAVPAFGGGLGPQPRRPSELLAAGVASAPAAAGRGHWPTSGRWHRHGRQLIVELS
jgi:hypothetical protein